MTKVTPDHSLHAINNHSMYASVRFVCTQKLRKADVFGRSIPRNALDDTPSGHREGQYIHIQCSTLSRGCGGGGGEGWITPNLVSAFSTQSLYMTACDTS